MKKIALYVMVVFYIVAGINHFVHPAFYLQIMPPWVPLSLQMVYASGLCEVAGALLLWLPATRRLGGWFIIMLLIAILPANIQMAVNFWRGRNPYLWLAILRLPLQAVLIWWAWIYTRKEVV